MGDFLYTKNQLLFSSNFAMLSVPNYIISVHNFVLLYQKRLKIFFQHFNFLFFQEVLDPPSIVPQTHFQLSLAFPDFSQHKVQVGYSTI